MNREYPTQQLIADIARALTPEELDEAAQGALAFFDVLNEEHLRQSASPLACRAGCSWCCWLRVDAFAHEILLIAHHVRKTFTEEEQADLLTRLASHADAVWPLSPLEHATTNLQCPLLVEGRCSIYAVRPQACRRHHSLDVEACKFVFDHPTDLEAPAAHDRPLFRALSEAMQRNIEAYAELGFDHTIYELGTALHEALQDAGSDRRWHHRGRTFLHASVTPAG